MITYHNAGLAGRDYSYMTVGDAYSGERVTFGIKQSNQELAARVSLDADQMQHLRDALTEHLRTLAPAPTDPMIEGSEIL